MEIRCPKCNLIVANEFVNISTDLAKCRNCSEIFKVSDTVNTEDISKLTKPPKGSNISISNNGDSIEILLPAKNFGFSDLFPLVFAIIWIGFLVFWTIGAAKASLLFALFSIPFWIIGGSVILGLINSFDEDHIVTIKDSGIELLINRPINSKEYFFKFTDIYSVKIGIKSITNPFTMAMNFRQFSKFAMMGFQAPAINYGGKSVSFFDHASDAEQDWIIKLLSRVIEKNK